MSTRPNPTPHGTQTIRQRGVTSWTRQSRTEPTHGAVTGPGVGGGGGGGVGQRGYECYVGLTGGPLTNERNNIFVGLFSSTDNSTFDCLPLGKVTSQIAQHLTIT